MWTPSLQLHVSCAKTTFTHNNSTCSSPGLGTNLQTFLSLHWHLQILITAYPSPYICLKMATKTQYVCSLLPSISLPLYYLNHTALHTHQDCQDRTVSQVTAKKNYKITNICFTLSGFIAITETACEIICL